MASRMATSAFQLAVAGSTHQTKNKPPKLGKGRSRRGRSNAISSSCLDSISISVFAKELESELESQSVAFPVDSDAMDVDRVAPNTDSGAGAFLAFMDVDEEYYPQDYMDVDLDLEDVPMAFEKFIQYFSHVMSPCSWSDKTQTATRTSMTAYAWDARHHQHVLGV